jgi:hypothetical protein
MRMQKQKLEEIQTLFSKHMQAFQRDMSVAVSTPDPEDERQIQGAIAAVLARNSPQAAKGLGAILAELMETTAARVLSLTDSQEKKDRLLEVLSKHLRSQIIEVSEILTADLD